MCHSVFYPRISHFKLFLQPTTLRSGKRRLAFSNHIKRKDVVVDVVGRIEPRATGKVRGGSIANALRHRWVRLGENLQRRASVPADLLKQLQSVLDSLLITNLVEQNTEGGAVLDGLSTTLTLDCGFVTTRINKLLTFSELTDGWTFVGGGETKPDGYGGNKPQTYR